MYDKKHAPQARAYPICSWKGADAFCSWKRIDAYPFWLTMLCNGTRFCTSHRDATRIWKRADACCSWKSADAFCSWKRTDAFCNSHRDATRITHGLHTNKCIMRLLEFIRCAYQYQRVMLVCGSGTCFFPQQTRAATSQQKDHGRGGAQPARFAIRHGRSEAGGRRIQALDFRRVEDFCGECGGGGVYKGRGWGNGGDHRFRPAPRCGLCQQRLLSRHYFLIAPTLSDLRARTQGDRVRWRR